MRIHILLVQQTSDLQTLIHRVLSDQIETARLQCVTRKEPGAALQYLAEHPQLSIIMVDIGAAQESISSLLSALYRLYPLLPVIVMLPDHQLSSIRHFMNQGAFDFLTLPIDEQDLKHTLKKAIRYHQQLRRSTAQYRRQLNQLTIAVETMRLGVTITDLDRKILYTNPAEARMHGYEITELLGRDVGIFAPPDLRQPMTLKEIQQWKGSIRESRNIRSDGTQFPVWLMSDIIRDSTGSPTAIVTSCEDISERKHVEEELKKHQDHLEELIKERTRELRQVNEALQQKILERKHAEDNLRASEEEYRLLFENLPDLFYRIDTSGKLLLVSPSITQFLGYTVEEITGWHIGKELFVYPEQWEDFLMLMEAEGRLENFEVLLKRQDGSYEWGSANARIYKNRAGQIAGYEGIIRDISVRKQAEMELRVAHDELQNANTQLQELNASKDKFFSIISHDLRNQFTTLMGFTEIIEAKVDVYNTARLKDIIGKLKNSATRFYALFENLLTWSRLQRGAMICRPVTLSLFALAEQNVTMMAPKAEFKAITLKNLIPKDCHAYGDRSMVDTVIRNLLSNALKFTDLGGEISISAEQRGDEIEIAIADTGCGIDEAAVDLLFRIDATYTTTGTAGEHGTGLGLILCKELIEKNSGRIWAESEIGKGTTFTFTIPQFPQAEKD